MLKLLNEQKIMLHFLFQEFYYQKMKENDQENVLQILYELYVLFHIELLIIDYLILKRIDKLFYYIILLVLKIRKEIKEINRMIKY
jgi:hypothetical protein